MLDFVVARYNHIPSGHCLFTRQGFLTEMNWRYDKNMKSLQYAVNFCNRKMGCKFYYIVSSDDIHTLEYVANKFINKGGNKNV